MSDFRELSRSVKGLTVLVTGAACGMGRATARCSPPRAPTSRSPTHAEAAQTVADDIKARGGTAKAWTLDVAKADDITEVVGKSPRISAGSTSS